MDEFVLDEFVLDVDSFVPPIVDGRIDVVDEFILESLAEGTGLVLLRPLMMLELELVSLLALITELSPSSAGGFSMGKSFACTPLSLPKLGPDSVGVNGSEDDKLLALTDVLLLAMDDEPEFFVD